MEYNINGHTFVCRQWLASREELTLPKHCPPDHWAEFQSFFYVRSRRTIIEAHCGLEVDQVGPDTFENLVLATNVTCYGVDSESTVLGLSHWISHGRAAVLGELFRRLKAKKSDDWVKDYILDATLPTKQLAYRIHFDLLVRDKQVSEDQKFWRSILEPIERPQAPPPAPHSAQLRRELVAAE